MKKIIEKIFISDKSYIVPAKMCEDSFFSNCSLNKKTNSNEINEEIYCKYFISKQHSNKNVNDCVLSHSDEGLMERQISYTHIDKSVVKDAQKLKESEIYTYNENAVILDYNEFYEMDFSNIELNEKLEIKDDGKNNYINNINFSISDKVNIICASDVKQQINLMQKDYTKLSLNEEFQYCIDGRKYCPVGELKDGVFEWYLNYDFNYETEVNIEYFKEKNKKINVFSRTNNICLIYSKSNEFSESNFLSVDLLPLSLDGTPIKKVKIDLNQNFINPIEIKYNFNSLYISGDNYTLNSNTIKHFSKDSYSTGKIDFSSLSYIRKISYNGRYSLPCLSSCSYNKLYTIDSINCISEFNRYIGKVLPFRTNKTNYKLDDIYLLNGSFECLSYIWKIEGIGEWRNIILSTDDENGCNYGNIVDIESLSYRYDGYIGWEGSDYSGNYVKFASNISGVIELDEIKEWGIGESDGLVEYSVDDGKTWYVDLRGKQGKKLIWRSVGKISYLIIWKNNNKEIFYSNRGEVELNCEEFGGICFERNKKLKVKVDDEWVDIINGDELSGKSIGKLIWEYDGDKIIFVKDLREKTNIITKDIENQGIHYGRIGVYVNEGKSNCNFYRLLGINDKNVEEISCNPLFSWKGEEELYSVDFREVELSDFKKEFCKAKLNYEFNKIGKFQYEYIFDTNGCELNNIGFIDYREYFGSREFYVHKGEIISVYLYDNEGNEVVLPYEILIENDFNVIKFDCLDEFWDQEFRVVVFYNVHNWSETRFRVDFEKHDIEAADNYIVEINTVSDPLKVFLYDSNNNELQLPINIEKNRIKIDLRLSENLIFNNLSKAVIFVKGKNDCNGLICEKFSTLKSSLKTYFNPIVSMYEGKFLPNNVSFEESIVKTNFPFYVENSIQYVIEEYKNVCKEKILSKIFVETTRKFNSKKNNFKTFVCCSDDLKFWSEWKEFNEEFELCEIGKYFKLKVEMFTIKESDEKITDFYFCFENLYLAKRKTDNSNVYFSLPEELKNDTLYMMRIKSYNGVKYSSWSNLECYLTNDKELNLGAENLYVDSENERRVVNEINFNWVGNQNVLTSDNLTTLNDKKREIINLTKGKDYIWKINDESSKNSKGNFSVNIKPPIPTFED